MGTFFEPSTVTLADGVSIFGGYFTDWRRNSSSQPTVVQVAHSTAVQASMLDKFTVLELLEFRGADAGGSGVSAYGLFASNSDALVVRRCTFVAGRGSAGAAAIDRTDQALKSTLVGAFAGSTGWYVKCVLFFFNK